MPTKEQRAALELYRKIMTEVRKRISIVDLATTNHIPIESPFITEICFLQFRMMCELLALGSLVAHGDIAKGNRFEKAYQADSIMNDLEKLNPNFYPVVMRKIASTDGTHHFQPVNPQPFPKEELLRIYRSCGDRLHKGSIRKIVSGNIPVQLKYPQITEIAQKFRDLMSSHTTFIFGGTKVLICQSLEVGTTANINVIFGERAEE